MPCLEKSEKEKAAERGKEMTNNEFAEHPRALGELKALMTRRQDCRSLSHPIPKLPNRQR